MKPPTYRNWERFWTLHLTEEFRQSVACQKDGACKAVDIVDGMRSFYAALAGDENVDAVMPPTLSKLYCRLVQHLSYAHGLPELDENKLSKEELADLSPVFDALFEEFPSELLALVEAAATFDPTQK